MKDEREVDVNLAERVAQSWQCPHVLVSAKTGLNINGAYVLVVAVVQQHLGPYARPGPR